MIRAIPLALFSGAFFLNLLLLFFGNSDLFPLGAIDFWFFFALSFLFALYRPGWAFLLFLSLLPFETVSLAPETLPLSLRPYQLLGGTLIGALLFRFLFRRSSFPFVKLKWFDALPLFVALGGFLAVFSAFDRGSAGKQAIVIASFAALYFLSRQFLGNERDVRRVVPFLVLPAFFSTLFAFWQSLRFTAGLSSFETMPGRPNAFFAEPDWLGMYFIFSLSLFLSFLFFVFEKNASKIPEKIHLPSGGAKCKMQNFGALFSHSSFQFFIFYFLFFIFSLGLLLTVARSAWVGFAFSLFVFLVFLLVGKHSWNIREWRWGLFARGGFAIVFSFALALFVVWAFQLTTFDLGNRAKSTFSGMQEITVSCEAPIPLPEEIADVSELLSYGCRHIRLEEIEAERRSERFVSAVLRPDPSIEARRAIKEKTFETLKGHWLFGIGWGSIGSVLGTDERGASLNASNAFLESWLGGGFIGLLSFLFLWMLVPIFAVRMFFSKKTEAILYERRAISVFFLISWIGFTIFNLVNSGILLGFVWVFLGGIGMLTGKRK